MVIIRNGKEKELSEIGRLWADFMHFNAEFNDSFKVGENADNMFSKEMAEKISDPDCCLAVAEKDGRLIGFCFAYISSKPKYFRLDKFGFIGDLYVKPEYRRQGIGRMLVENVISFLKKRKVKQIELLVASKNYQAAGFWGKLGFCCLLNWMYKRV